jgi:outer membrane protein insertion porin family
VVGNDKTMTVSYTETKNEARRKYSKELLVRVQIGQLGFFDPEAIDPKFKNVASSGTVDIEYN